MGREYQIHSTRRQNRGRMTGGKKRAPHRRFSRREAHTGKSPGRLTGASCPRKTCSRKTRSRLFHKKREGPGDRNRTGPGADWLSRYSARLKAQILEESRRFRPYVRCLLRDVSFQQTPELVGGFDIHSPARPQVRTRGLLNKR